MAELERVVEGRERRWAYLQEYIQVGGTIKDFAASKGVSAQLMGAMLRRARRDKYDHTCFCWGCHRQWNEQRWEARHDQMKHLLEVIQQEIYGLESLAMSRKAASKG